jgi:Zn-dependent oligopeptidase
MKVSVEKKPKELLVFLNNTYSKLHTTYEDLFWISHMGDSSVNEKMNIAKSALEAFRADPKILQNVRTAQKKANKIEKERLGYWNSFLSMHQVPNESLSLKNKITELETKLQQKRATRKEGYIDPKTNKFIKTSVNALRSMIGTADDEKLRKAYFDAVQELAKTNVKDYIEIVSLRNQYARTLGYEDFYAYKLAIEEKMTKKELFGLFDEIYEKTKYAFLDVRKLEKERPGLRKPWNYAYMMTGSFTKEEEPYYPFEEAIMRWATSFAALGISYKGGTLVLDLLDREGKYSNGFCHWPELVRFEGKTRIPARAQFTCNVVLGSFGEADQGMHTLFHEGGHAAHLLNASMPDVCVNSEYPPLSTAWAETQSMFLDRIFSSVEWQSRYATTITGEAYPFDLFERQVRALNVVAPLSFMSINIICQFEREIYEAKTLTEEKVLKLAKKHFKRHTDRSVDSLSILETPHLYSWESSCSYHGYGLAILALTQWREYFFNKYGYIVDNPHIGKEMQTVWKYGGSKSFPEFVKMATGKKLSAKPHITQVTKPLEKKIAAAKHRVGILSQKPVYKKKLDLDAKIVLVHGKEKIADNKNGIEAMSNKYATWLKTQYPKK